jgi:hypothetical protein
MDWWRIPPAAHGAAEEGDDEEGEDPPTDDEPSPVRQADARHLHALEQLSNMSKIFIIIVAC